MTFYREEAERWGLSTRLRMDSRAESVVDIEWAARLAAHFGRLALGQTSLVCHDQQREDWKGWFA